MSHLRQLRDYLKNNRTRAAPPRIHMLTAESNKRVKRKNFKKGDSCPQTMRENSLRQQPREFRPRHRKAYSPRVRADTQEHA